jgi:DNA polymerase
MLQPQNLPHQFLNPEQTEDAIHAIKAGVAHPIYGDDIMPVMASCLRGLLIPQPDHKFLISDLANIEGRIQAWVCQEGWKLEAYRAYDRGEGKDLYVRAYAATFGVDPDGVTKAQRQVGKVMELAFAYNGGVSAFLNFGGRRLNFDELYDRIIPSAPEALVSRAWQAWDWAQERGATFDLDAKTYVVCDAIKLLWRAAHPKISHFWGALERCAHEATQSPDQTYTLGRIKVRRAGDWLLIRKPSGQCLSYKSPRLNNNKLSFEGTLETTGTWGRIETYGGKLFENICQSLACDVFSEGLLRIDRQGITTRLTVHDEVVCEVPIDSHTTVRDVSALLATPPSWAQDIPLAAEGFEALRYRK